jgi:hypothetical protein
MPPVAVPLLVRATVSRTATAADGAHPMRVQQAPLTTGGAQHVAGRIQQSHVRRLGHHQAGGKGPGKPCRTQVSVCAGVVVVVVKGG